MVESLRPTLMKKVFHKTHFSRLELLLLYFFDFFVYFRFSGGDARRSGRMDGMRIFCSWLVGCVAKLLLQNVFHISRHDEVRGVRKMLHFFNFRFGVSLRGAEWHENFSYYSWLYARINFHVAYV